MSSAPAASSPMNASSTSTNPRPRRWSGRNGRSGSWSIRPSDSHSTGTVSIHSRHAPRIRVACSIGQNRARRRRWAMGKSSSSIERDRADVASTTPDGPEDVGLPLPVHVDEPAVGGHHVGGDDRVARQAVATDEPAETAAQGVAPGRPHRATSPRGRRGRAVPRPRRAAWPSTPASTRARRAVGSMRMPSMRPVLSNRTSSAQAIVPRVVATGVEGDTQPALAREADGRDDIVGRPRPDDAHRSLIDREVPDLSVDIPRMRRPADDLARQARTEVAKAHRGPPASTPAVARTRAGSHRR